MARIRIVQQPSALPILTTASNQTESLPPTAECQLSYDLPLIPRSCQGRHEGLAFGSRGSPCPSHGQPCATPLRPESGSQTHAQLRDQIVHVLLVSSCTRLVGSRSSATSLGGTELSRRPCQRPSSAAPPWHVSRLRRELRAVIAMNGRDRRLRLSRRGHFAGRQEKHS